MTSLFQFNSRSNNLKQNSPPAVNIFAIYENNHKPSAIYDIYMKVLQNTIPSESIDDVLLLFLDISNHTHNGESRTNAALGICALAFKDLISAGRCEEVVDLLIKESHDPYDSSPPDYHLVDDWGSLSEIALWGLKLIAEKGRLHANQTEKVIDTSAMKVDDSHPHIRRNALSALTELVLHSQQVPLSRVDELHSIFQRHAVNDIHYIREWSMQGLKELAKHDLLTDSRATETLSLFVTNVTHDHHVSIRAHCILGLASLLTNQRVPKNMIEQCHTLLLLKAENDPSGAVSSEAFLAIAHLVRAGVWPMERTDELTELLVEKIECDSHNATSTTVVTISACLLVVGELVSRMAFCADSLGDLLLLLVAKASDSDQSIARNALLAINQCIVGRKLSAAHFAAIAQIMLDYAQRCDMDDVEGTQGHSDVVTVALWGLGSLAEGDAVPVELIPQVATLLLREVGTGEEHARHRMLLGLFAMVRADRLSLALLDEVVDLMVALVEENFKLINKHAPHGSLLRPNLSRTSSTSTLNGDALGQEVKDEENGLYEELFAVALATLKNMFATNAIARARTGRIHQLLTSSSSLTDIRADHLTHPMHLVSQEHIFTSHVRHPSGPILPSPDESARVRVLSEEIVAMGEHLRALISVHNSHSTKSEQEAAHILSLIESHMINNELWQGRI